MTLDNARSQIAHLLRRAGFGATAGELDYYASLGFAGALDQLLNPAQVDDSATDRLLQPLSANLGDKKQIEASKFWWLNRMLYTQRPLQEKMTLFWHNHFATANSKVANSVLMLQQIELFRDSGMGSFETLLQKVTRDPAMLIWLDNRLNRKAAPNENYAREVQELFTVGIGNFTEDDVHAAARAFTGLTLDKNLNSVFNANQHDNGAKTFQGQTGNFGADDILGILVRNPATARFITTKLFTWFVYDNPDPSTIDRLSNTFTSSNFDITSVLRDMFTGPEFLSDQAFHGIIKQPVDFVVGSLKSLNVQNVGPDVTQVLRRMGQDLLNPTDVSGWKGGSAWVNSTTLFERFNWADRLSMGRDSTKPYFADIPGQIAAQNLGSPDALVDFYLGLFVDGDTTPEARQALIDYLGTLSPGDAAGIDLKGRGMVHLAMSVPTYQLG